MAIGGNPLKVGGHFVVHTVAITSEQFLENHTPDWKSIANSMKGQLQKSGPGGYMVEGPFEVCGHFCCADNQTVH